MGFGGPVAIRLEGIESAMRLVQPDNPALTLDRVIALGRSVIRDISEKAEEQREAKKP